MWETPGSDHSVVGLQSDHDRAPRIGLQAGGLGLANVSGGVRKLRWAAPGRGKRGGYRVIYYVRRAHGVIWMLTMMYPKNVADNIPTHVLRQIRKEVEDG